MVQTNLTSIDLTERGDSSRKLGSINGFRGLAILLVIVHHLFIPYYGPQAVSQNASLAIALVGALVRNCARGVDIFFILSGFVLYLPYARDRRQFDGCSSVKHFYLHRAARLLPLYALVVLVGMTFHPINPIGGARWYLELGGLVTTLFVFSPHGFMPPSNIVLWSVGVEIWFSILFPFLVILSQRLPFERIVIALTAISTIFAFAGVNIHVDRVGQFLPFTNGAFGKSFEFVLGMYVAKIFVSIRKETLRGSNRFLKVVVGIVGCGTAVALHEVFSGENWMHPMDTLLFCVSFSLVLLNVLLGSRSLQTAMSVWPLQLLGCMCYSIYAWHGIVLNSIIPSGASVHETLKEIPLFLVLTIFLSAITYRFVEFGQRSDVRVLFLLEHNDL